MGHASNDKVKEQAKGTPKSEAIKNFGKGNDKSPMANFLKDAVDEMQALDEKIKGINAEKKDIKTRVKEHGVSIQAFNDVYRDLKLEPEVRRDREEDRAIIKDCLGLQLTMFDEMAMAPEHDAAKDAKDEAAGRPDKGKKRSKGKVKKIDPATAAKAAMAEGTAATSASAVH